MSHSSVDTEHPTRPALLATNSEVSVLKMLTRGAIAAIMALFLASNLAPQAHAQTGLLSELDNGPVLAVMVTSGPGQTSNQASIWCPGGDVADFQSALSGIGLNAWYVEEHDKLVIYAPQANMQDNIMGAIDSGAPYWGGVGDDIDWGGVGDDIDWGGTGDDIDNACNP